MVTNDYERERAERAEQVKRVSEDPFLAELQGLKEARDESGKRIYSEREIAEHFNMTTSELRKKVSVTNAQLRHKYTEQARRFREAGYTVNEIAQLMNRNESSIRLLLDEGVNERFEAHCKEK